MVGQKPRRYLAPVAIIAVIVAVVVIVLARTETSHQTTVPRPADKLPASHPVSRRPRFYMVKPGDSLSSISLKTNVSVTSLESLNPSLNPNALQAGQRIRVSP